MARPSHPDPKIERSLLQAERLGWTIRRATHAYLARCPCPYDEVIIVAVGITKPRPINQLRREFAKCARWSREE